MVNRLHFLAHSDIAYLYRCMFVQAFIIRLCFSAENENSSKVRPRLQKSKSAAPSSSLFRNVDLADLTFDARETAEKNVPADETTEFNGYSEDMENVDEKASGRRRAKRDRSNSFGKYRRLEARPLRRSSISSVRRSDATVREKGQGYTFDDGLLDKNQSRKISLQPLKISSRDVVKTDQTEPRPSTPSALKEFSKDLSVVDINMAETHLDERKKKQDAERQSVLNAVKTAAAGKSWAKEQLPKKEEKVKKLGTFERKKRKERRAMYPPLSMVFNAEDNDNQIENVLNGKDLPGEAGFRLSGMPLKIVEISLDDDKTAPGDHTNTGKETSQVNTAPKTVSATTTNLPTSPTTTAPRSPNSSNSPTTPLYGRPRKPSAGSLVASRAARLTNLIANDFRPPTVKDKWAEREERKKPAHAALAKEEKSAPTSSPGAQRRSLPRLPSREEPFHSTKETTKIIKRRPTGRPNASLSKVHKDLGLDEKETEDKKMAEDMGFIVVDIQDGISTPEKGINQSFHVQFTWCYLMEGQCVVLMHFCCFCCLEAIKKRQDDQDGNVMSESSEEDFIEDISPKFQRANAKRFGKASNCCPSIFMSRKIYHFSW